MDELPRRLTRALEDRYELERELGRGGMATVYLARDLKHGRRVAIKVLRQELAAAVGPERFLDEIEITAGLTHPHILPLLDSGEADSFLYFVMPYIEGETLRDRLKREKQLPIEVSHGIAREVADALQYAHSRNLIHRDIKPENILLSQGHAVVADFGIARAMEGGQGLTGTGVAIGTPGYMSPEQASGEVQLDARSDLYSLGCVLYEMLAGQPPYTGATAESVLNQHRAAEIPRITSVRPTVPEAIESILTRLLAKAPADRYATPQDLIQALGTEPQPTTPSRQAVADRRRLLPLGLGAVVLVVAVLAVGLNIGELRDRIFGGARPGAIESLAVLPLENFSSDPAQAYFVDGMTEALTAELGKIHSLIVISRTSAMRYKGTDKSIPEIGRELKVDAVVEGSVLRIGDRVRITAQLIQASTDRHLWAENYERDLRDAMTLQGEVARDIARQVQAELTPKEEISLTKARPVDPAALEAYLKGRAASNLGTMEGGADARKYFEQALQIDPDFAMAHLGMADYYFANSELNVMPSERALPRAEQAAKRALELDDTLAEAHARLASIYVALWDWPAAEREATRALELNPNSAQANSSYSFYMSAIGRDDEAIASARRAQELDPLAPEGRFALGWRYITARRYDEAIEQFTRVLEMGNAWGRYGLGSAYLHKGMYQQAIEVFKENLDAQGTAEASATLGWAYAAAGMEAEARNILAEVIDRSEREYVSPLSIGLIYAELGEIDSAFEWLDRASAEHDSGLSGLKVAPAFDLLRSDPRFDDLLRRVGLADV